MKKRTLDIAVISDVNLGHNLCRINELRAYLSSIRPKKLILNGDFVYNASTSSQPFSTLELNLIKKLIDMTSQGTEIVFISGEKDTLSASFRSLNFSDFTIKKEAILEIDGKKAWFLHGDALFPCNRLNIWLYKFGGLGLRLIRFINRLKVKLRNNLNGLNKEFQYFNSKIIERFEKSISRLAIHKGYSFVICGHTHHPKKELLETNKGKCTYLNSGDWITHLTALEYTFRRWKIYNYSHDKLSPFFADEDLKKLEVNELQVLLDQSSLKKSKKSVR